MTAELFVVGLSWRTAPVAIRECLAIPDDEAGALLSTIKRAPAVREHDLTDEGLPAEAGDGMSLWVSLPVSARAVAERLTRRGWLVRTGDEFRLEPSEKPSRHLRLTVHDLTETEAVSLAGDLVDAVRTAG